MRLFGTLDLRMGDEPLPPLESARAQSLLAYLVLHGGVPQPRQHLAFVLWPESSESQARTNLRHVLHNLRHALPHAERFLEVSPQALRWRRDESCWIDVAAFEESLDRSEGPAATGTEAEVADLREAVGLYSGDLLSGCYDEWLFDERERLRQRYLAALHRLAARLGDGDDHAGAVHYAQELLRCDPLREEAYRLLMRTHERAGDRARAVRAYHACATTLQRELGVEPSTATRRQYETLTGSDFTIPAVDTAATPSHPGGHRGLPLVGRDKEWTALRRFWRAAEDGAPRLVVISGEAGIGKTRLAEELRRWCAHRGALVVEARSYPAEGELAYGLLTGWLRTEDVVGRVRRLEAPYRTELARLLPELLAEDPDLPAPGPLPEREQRLRLFDAVARAVLDPGRPTLVVADDAQWSDPESLQLVHYLLRLQPGGGLLVVATVRREEAGDTHPLHGLLAGLHALDRCSEIELGRLARQDTAALAAHAAGATIEGDALDRLHGDTEGNPLFVVETVRAGWGHPDDDRPPVVSPRLQAVITARLAQLSAPARALVGVAASVGREFTSDVVAGATDADGPELARALDELWRRGIVREQGVDAYDFAHGKIREVAYLALGGAERRHHHLRIARALLRLHAGDAGQVGAQLALHYERAGAVDEAVTWHVRAAHRAQELHAHAEAVRQIEYALELVTALPHGDARRARELEVLSELPTPLTAVDGFGSRRLVAIQRRAVEAAAALSVDLQPPVLRSLALTHLVRDEFDDARRAGLELRAWGTREADDVLLVEAGYVLGVAAFWQGAFTAARDHFESAVRRARPQHRATQLLRYGFDPEVGCVGRLANTLWFLGYPDEARAARDAAVRLAAEINSPNTSDLAFTFAAVLALDIGETEAYCAYADQLEAMRGEHRWRLADVTTEAFGGLADVLGGRSEGGIARIRAAMAGRGDTHAPGLTAILLRVLVAAHDAAGDPTGGLVAADEALLRSGTRIWEPEVRRLRATFLHALGATAAEVDAELSRALDSARRLGAVPLESSVARTRAALA